MQTQRIEKLSTAEREVFGWLVAGKSNWEISMILQKSTWTVKNQVKSIYSKLGVNSRVSAMRWFIETETDEFRQTLPTAAWRRREGVALP
jgi:DNA-binding CsgD family transcriptional regulator